MSNSNEFHIRFEDSGTKDLDNARHSYKMLYGEQERLRLAHNKFGCCFREGKIDEEEWKKYLKSNFNPKSFTISKEIGDIRNKLLSEFSFKLQSFDTMKIEYPSQVNTDERKMHYLLVLTHILMNSNRDNMLLSDADNKIFNLKEKFKHGL